MMHLRIEKTVKSYQVGVRTSIRIFRPNGWTECKVFKRLRDTGVLRREPTSSTISSISRQHNFSRSMLVHR